MCACAQRRWGLCDLSRSQQTTKGPRAIPSPGFAHRPAPALAHPAITPLRNPFIVSRPVQVLLSLPTPAPIIPHRRPRPTTPFSPRNHDHDHRPPLPHRRCCKRSRRVVHRVMSRYTLKRAAHHVSEDADIIDPSADLAYSDSDASSSRVHHARQPPSPYDESPGQSLFCRFSVFVRVLTVCCRGRQAHCADAQLRWHAEEAHERVHDLRPQTAASGLRREPDDAHGRDQQAT